MFFSILMSIYKNEKAEFFEQCMDSIYNQSLQSKDIVIVHDGPLKSELYQVLDKWKSLLPITEIVLPENVGLGEALNTGLIHCKYDLVARVDTDDINLPNRFQIQYEYMTNNPDTVMCGSHISEFEDRPEEIVSLRKVPLGNEIAKCIFKRNPFNHMSVMYRKSAVLDSGGYKHLKFMEDYYLWVRMHLKGYKLDNIDLVLVNARIGNGMLERRKGIDYYKSELKFMKYLLNTDIPNKPRDWWSFLNSFSY
ncbi:glycosyltransferase [Photobacterium leiognathi]|uniref:glycosyltransferase n=1 Tax=Photobacterium leiognathi TaxID=553611 RepID=UPI0027390175|nr:glycosyltransferase [Photobacterium leiognathi]